MRFVIRVFRSLPRSGYSLLVAAAAFLLFCGCDAKSRAPAVVNPRIGHVRKGSLKKEIRLISPVRGEDSLEVFAEIQGRVGEVYIKKGRLVKAGDPLAVLESLDAVDDLKDANLRVAIARCELEAEAKKPDNTLGEKKAELKLQLEMLKADRFARNLERLKVVAPCDGEIAQVMIKKGDMVAGKSPFSSGTKVAEIAGSGTYRVKCVVGEREISMISLHQHAEIEIEAIPGLRTVGEIVDIQNVPEQNAATPSFPLIIQFSSISKEVKPGMTASIRLSLAEVQDCLLAPVQAIYISSGQAQVAIVEAEGTSRLEKVELGIDDGTNVEIRGNVSEGQKITLF